MAVLNSFSQLYKFTVWWFSDGSDHVEAEVVLSPIQFWVSTPSRTPERRNAALSWAEALDGVGDPAQSTDQVADDLDVQAGRVVLAGGEPPSGRPSSSS